MESQHAFIPFARVWRLRVGDNVRAFAEFCCHPITRLGDTPKQEYNPSFALTSREVYREAIRTPLTKGHPQWQ